MGHIIVPEACPAILAAFKEHILEPARGSIHLRFVNFCSLIAHGCESLGSCESNQLTEPCTVYLVLEVIDGLALECDSMVS